MVILNLSKIQCDSLFDWSIMECFQCHYFVNVQQIKIPSEILTECSELRPMTATSRAITSHFPQQLHQDAYFRRPAFEVGGYPPIVGNFDQQVHVYR
jgi:hypothetical protein